MENQVLENESFSWIFITFDDKFSFIRFFSLLACILGIIIYIYLEKYYKNSDKLSYNDYILENVNSKLRSWKDSIMIELNRILLKFNMNGNAVKSIYNL
jgi:hypothetical protein